MSKMQSLQQALKNNSGRAASRAPEPVKASNALASPTGVVKSKPPSREGKEYTGAWLNPDFGASLRLVQIRKRRDERGKKVFLDDLFAEALNDLFRKYDVPTVHHE